MNYVKNIILEISRNSKVYLKLINPNYQRDFKFKFHARNAQNMAKMYHKLNWPSQLVGLYNFYDALEDSIDDILSIQLNDPKFNLWLNELSTLKTKVNAAKIDCKNGSWNWLSIKF